MVAPVFTSLLHRVLTIGIPQSAFYTNSFLTFALTLGAGQWWFACIGILLHYLLYIGTTNDRYFFEVLIAAVAMPEQLE